MRIAYNTEVEDFCLKYVDTSEDYGMIFGYIEDIVNCLKEIENEQRSENIKTT